MTATVIPLFGESTKRQIPPVRTAPAATPFWPFDYVPQQLFEQLTDSEKGAVEGALKHAIEKELIRRALRTPQ